MSDGIFGYTCEGCHSIFYLTAAEFEMSADPSGRFRCDICNAKPKKKAARKKQYDSRRDHGCIVTAVLPDGNVRSYHRGGHVSEALSQIVALFPAGAVVQSISTYRSVLRDLDSQPRGQRRRGTASFDPYQVERAALGRIGRLDLLPPQAKRRRSAA